MPIGQDSILDVNLQKALGATQSLKYTETAGIADNVETTIMTFSDTTDRIIGSIWVSGQGYAKYTIYVDTVKVGTIRSSADYSLNLTMGTSLLLPTASVVDVKVEHFVTTETLDFECALWGN